MSCSYLHSLALARVLAAVPVALVATAAGAQDAANPAVEPTRQPAAAPAAVPAAAAAASAPDTPRATLERVEISGRRSDVDQRRQSTAAKIVVGREELDKYGDSSLGEVLRRLPGVTVPGAPGRGGAPRLRGLGGGYTQILLDGQRVPPGFSFDSIEPDQIERIEILRAPTAETGARAIAGTINIITREGFRRRDDELKLGFGLEEGRLSPGLNWTHNGHDGPLTYSWTLSLLERRRRSESVETVEETELGSGALLRRSEERSVETDRRRSVNLSSRWQWRLGDGGGTLTVQPLLYASETPSVASSQVLSQVDSTGSPLLSYDHAGSASTSRFHNARLNAQWRGPVSENLRGEWSGSLGQYRYRNQSLRREYDSGAALLRTLDDDIHSREGSGLLSGKLSTTLEDGSQLVGGLELERIQRRQGRSTLENGTALAFGNAEDELDASSQRVAAFVQDEWTPAPGWSANVGLRWEGIRTEGMLPDGSRPVNRSSIWTPLAHAVWKPDPKARDQWRIGLTRSYRSPDLGQLISPPRVAAGYPVSGGNVATSPDRAANAELRPELASGLDLAYEHYPQAGGLFSVSAFARRISDLIRQVTTLESVTWSSQPRWVSRPQNIGDATTLGLELEARGRADHWAASWWADAPRTDLRANLALYRSWVKNLDGPDNRLAEQPQLNANLGFDHRLRGTPLGFGGNLNWAPGYRTRLAEDRWVEAPDRRVIDAYATWAFDAHTLLRLSASNLLPRDHRSLTQVDTAGTRQISTTETPSHIAWQLRLELRL